MNGTGLINRRDKKRAATLERIFDTAMRLFAEKGFQATTVDEITERADVAKGTFFNYFPTKEHVLEQFSRLQLQRIEQAREQVLRGENLRAVLAQAGIGPVVGVGISRGITEGARNLGGDPGTGPEAWRAQK